MSLEEQKALQIEGTRQARSVDIEHQSQEEEEKQHILIAEEGEADSEVALCEMRSPKDIPPFFESCEEASVLEVPAIKTSVGLTVEQPKGQEPTLFEDLPPSLPKEPV